MTTKDDDPVLKRVPDTLYHYTDQAGMLGILQSKVIWATKIQFLSDQHELSHAIDLAKPLLREMESHGQSDHEASFFRHLCDIVDELARFAIYICSFSENPDVLSQWRAYSPQGTGYALGFNTEALSPRMEAQQFRLANCYYEEAEQARFLKLISSVASTSFRADLDPATPPKTRQDFDSLSATRRFVVNFALAGPMLKDHAFSDEVEWRMISGPYANLAPERLRVRSGRSFPVPYYEFELTELGEPLLLNELVIGPCPDPDLVEFAVKELFRPGGDVLCNNVRHSPIPYRNW